MNAKLLAAAAAGVLALLAGGPASAAVITLGGYTLEDNATFGSQFGVHADNNVSESGVTVLGIVDQDGSLVTFHTSDSTGLLLNGSGEATINGNPSLDNLTVDFAKGWDKVTFDFESANNGTFTLGINGTAFGTCSLCNISQNGANKFIVSGSNITELAFTFDPAISDAKQFRLDGVAAVPEPASWAMMILGLGGVGFMLRRQRRARPAFA